MSAAPDPVDPAIPPDTPEISQAAQVARQRLHEEIERVRLGVEEMLDEQDSGNGNGNGASASADTRRELDELRIETRNYVKKKVRKSEKKLERSIREMDDRTDRLERRINQVEADREKAEVRIHNNTEKMLDGLLKEMRMIADRIAGPPARAPAPSAPTTPAPARPMPPQGAVGRIGPPLDRGRPGKGRLG